MAISDFGESLLSKQRERREKEQRKTDRQALLGTAATVGIGLYRNNLRKKQEEFFNSQAVMDLKLKNAKAQEFATKTDNYVAAVTSSGKNMRGYHVDMGTDLARQEALFEFGKDPLKRADIEAGLYDDRFRSAGAAYADRVIPLVEEAQNFTREYRTSGKFEDVLSRVNQHPQNVASGIAGMFRGKTAKDLDEDTLEAMRSTTLGGMLAPTEKGKRSKVDRIAEQFALVGSLSEANKIVELEDRPNEKTNYSIQFRVNQETGETEVITTEQRVNRSNNEQVARPTYEINKNASDPTVMQSVAVKKLKANFDPRAEAQKELTNEGYLEYIKRVRAFNDDSIYLSTTGDYTKAMEIWINLAADKDNNYLKPESKLSTYNAAQRTWIQSSDAAKLLNQYRVTLEKDPDKANDMLKTYYETLDLIGVARVDL